MSKPEWGTKRICPNCGARYYDMRRDPVTCPKCGAPFDAESLVKSRKRAVAPAAVEEVAPLEEELEADLAAEPGEDSEAVTEIPVGGEEAGGAEEEEAEPAAAGQGKGRSKAGDKGGEKKEGEEEDEEVLEDASELGEDEDDMAEVIENVDEEDDR